MTTNIVVTGDNGAECIIFTDKILYVQDAKERNGAYIHFSNEKVAILTKETYLEVLKKLGIAGSTKGKSSGKLDI